MVDEELLAKTTKLVSKVAPGLVTSVHRDREGAYLDLPVSPGADYRFSLYTGEPQILAKLMPPNEGRHFWYWPFEEQDYRSLQDQEADFFRCVRLILTTPTRITQRRGYVSHLLHCETDQTPDPQPIGGTYAAMCWARPPRIQGNVHVWRSPPVRPGAPGTR